MKQKLYKILVCPACKGALSISSDAEEVIDGDLHCAACDQHYPIVNGIPRFVALDNYAASFGYQWNLFRKEQIDSYNGTTLSTQRFWSETGWTEDEVRGKWVLDAGCGAGRFLDVAGGAGAEVVGIDISNAIDAAKANLEGRANIHFVQASIYNLPFRSQTFDHCYCIGVIQHTPDPKASLSAIADMVKDGGEIAVTIYPRDKWYTGLYSKYWLRPITKRASKESLLRAVQGVMPVAFPITSVLFSIPGIGRFFSFVIPIANYVHEKQLNRDLRYSWAVLDTFDMLSPAYDQPLTETEATDVLNACGISAVRRDQPGLNLVGKRVA